MTSQTTLQPRSKAEKDREAGQIFALMTRVEPKSFYEDIGEPTPTYPERTPSATASDFLPGRVQSKAAELFAKRFNRDAHDDSLILVGAALYDMAPIVLRGLRHHNDSSLNLQDRIAFVQHPKSLEAIATFARLPQSLLRFAVDDDYAYEFGSTHENGFSISQYYEPDAVVGCPRAYTGKEMAASDLFTEVASWAGELLVRAYDKHGIN